MKVRNKSYFSQVHQTTWFAILGKAATVPRNLACSRHLDSGEQVKSYMASTKGNTRGDWGGSEKTPVNICNKGSFRYTGFQYTLLLVDYNTFCQHSITSDVDEGCNMADMRHV